jgi:hypothetical protein
MKLISGEELVTHLVGEDDYEIKVLFPMIVRHVPRMTSMGPAESVVLSPYTYFADSDEYTFHRNQIVFIQDLNPKYESEYNKAIDDFVGQSTEPEPYNPQEMQELAERLQNMFRDKVKSEEDLDDFPVFTIESSKTIH